MLQLLRTSTGIEKRGNIHNNRAIASPFLKWAGGKSRLLDQYNKFFPKKFNSYFEPFLGGGAVFFYLNSLGMISKATLNDYNEELINTYRVIKKDVGGLIKTLAKYRNSKALFYRVRSLDRDNLAFNKLSQIERAARTIFLNKTCYNGLYRVNSQGQFNVPFGRYRKPVICDSRNLKTACKTLKKVILEIGDFEKAVEKSGKYDFVYLDPPYQPLNRTSSFTGYTSNGFGKAEQERLAKVFRKLHKKGVFLMLSNSDTAFIRTLYKGFEIHTVVASRAINCKAEGRGKIPELLITNY